MAALHKFNKEKISLRVKSSTLYRIIKKCYTYKIPLFLYDKNFESKNTISLPLINVNKKEIIVELKTEEKEIRITHLIRRFGRFFKFLPTGKEEQKYIYFKLEKCKLFQLLKFKIRGKFKIKSIKLFSKNKSKNYKNQRKKIEEDENKSQNTKETTMTTLSQSKN